MARDFSINGVNKTAASLRSAIARSCKRLGTKVTLMQATPYGAVRLHVRMNSAPGADSQFRAAPCQKMGPV